MLRAWRRLEESDQERQNEGRDGESRRRCCNGGVAALAYAHTYREPGRAPHGGADQVGEYNPHSQRP